ncbi:MAG TPA: carboxypeptidase-like regulatory domain-containing protein [Mycobacteriales bacterium]|nr:carboxypeptidase-like regulatory domain-containing protein [Mycobacteriales bacterium]
MTAELVGPEAAPEPVLAGRVVDRTGVPVAGAVLTVTAPDGTQAARADVAKDGTYALAELPIGPYTVIASAPGYGPQVRAGIAGDGQRYDFELAGSGAIAGQVRSSRQETGGVIATVVVTDTRGEVVGHAASDSSGLFRLAGLPGGSFAVTAHASGYRPEVTSVTVQPDRAANVAFLLFPLGAVKGLITSPAGSGLPDVTVTAVSAAGEVVASVVTDSAGGYELSGLADGEYTLVTGTYRPAQVPVVLGAGENLTADVELGVAPAR